MRMRTNLRRGSIIPLMAAAIIGLIGVLALSIDLGMIAIARAQVQNAADAAAMAGARTINGDDTGGYNLSSVPVNAVTAASVNRVLSSLVECDPKSIASAGADAWKSGKVKVEAGTYAYTYDDGNTSNESFKLEFPRSDTTEPYSACRVTVTAKVNMYFSRLISLSEREISATAVAVHRPRDVVIIMDLSGSMRFQSLPGIPYSGARTTSMNPETIFPQFGHYSDVTAAALKGDTSIPTGGGEQYDPSNISTTSNSGPPICDDFYQNASGVAAGAGNKAFTRAPDSQDKTPGGYNYLKTSGNTGASYAVTVKDVVGTTTFNANFEKNGYDQYQSAKSVFYTEGPGYWGKTFFIWPPDPRGSTLDANVAANHADNGAKDWRQRFFFKYNTSTGKLGWLDHNSILFNSTGGFKIPGTSTTVTENLANVTYNYRINYAAIFHWLRNQDPKPFPPIVRAGRIKYYDEIPDPSDTGLNNRFWTTATLTNLNERFWKEYIDFVLGFRQTGAGTYSDVQGSTKLTAMIGNGDLYKWGTTAVQISKKPDYYKQSGTISKTGGHAKGSTSLVVKVTTKPASGQYLQFGGSDLTYYKITAVSGSVSPYTVTISPGLAATVANGAALKTYSTQPVYMDYADNPYRPRHQYWFGPMTFVDWLGNYNTGKFAWPGNVHEAQAWACKVGIQTAIDDIKKNHPNDFIALAFFNDPKTSPSDTGYHNCAIVPLGRSYQQLKDSLWFPPSTITGGVSEITPYDADFVNVPRASGSTAPEMGFMIAYNLLSNSSKLRTYSQPQPKYRGAAGGLGRRGAERLVIFETDGVPNTRAHANIVNAGTDSYYPIRVMLPDTITSGSNVEWPSGGTYSASEVYGVVEQICKMDSASPPGYSSKRKTAYVHPIGYGSLFDPSTTSTQQTNALTFLQNVAYKGNTASTTNPADFPDSRRIYGTNEQRIDRIQKAFSDIMQSGVQVSLIQ